jgi:ABC-type multidrug transport system fused ATPase/permease subunit
MSILGILITQGTELTTPLYMKQFFNGLALGAPTITVVHGLIITLVIIAGLYLINWAAYRLMYFALIFLESKVVANLYAVAFKYLIGHSYHFFSSQFSGTLTRRVSKFANAYENLMGSIMMQFVPTSIYVTGAVVILFTRNHVLGLMLGAWAICFILFQYYVSNLQRP